MNVKRKKWNGVKKLTPKVDNRVGQIDSDKK